MSLLEDVINHYEHEKYPPEGAELDYDFVDGKWQPRTDNVETELVSEEDHDELRWGTVFVNVYQRGNEYVAVKDVRPATEMQDWGDYGDPEIYVVRPRTETIVKTFYDKVDN